MTITGFIPHAPDSGAARQLGGTVQMPGNDTNPSMERDF